MGDRFQPTADDLRMPLQILTLRRRSLDASQSAALDEFVALLVQEKIVESHALLSKLLSRSAN